MINFPTVAQHNINWLMLQWINCKATGINEFGCPFETQKQIIKQFCGCSTQPTANAG